LKGLSDCEELVVVSQNHPHDSPKRVQTIFIMDCNTKLLQKNISLS
jgi:hypothetical protein